MEEPEKFLKQYEAATNSHKFDTVQPLLAASAVYWFSDGSFEGHDAIRKAFEKTWATVKNEVYKIVNVRWIAESDTVAVCVYEFQWQGEVDGTKKSGIGRGTNVMSKVGDNWQMTHEHLSRFHHKECEYHLTDNSAQFICSDYVGEMPTSNVRS